MHLRSSFVENFATFPRKFCIPEPRSTVMQLTTEGITKAMRDDRTVTVNSHEIDSLTRRDYQLVSIFYTDAGSSWNEISDKPLRFKRLHCSDP